MSWYRRKSGFILDQKKQQDLRDAVELYGRLQTAIYALLEQNKKITHHLIVARVGCGSCADVSMWQQRYRHLFVLVAKHERLRRLEADQFERVQARVPKGLSLTAWQAPSVVPSQPRQRVQRCEPV